MLIERIPWPEGAPDLHAFFCHHQQDVQALLEDTLGEGRCIVVSRAGRSHAFDIVCEDALDRWRELLSPPQPATGIAIQQVFYAAYEASTWLERLPAPRHALAGPTLFVHEPCWSLCHDRKRQCMHIAANSSEQLRMLRERLRRLCALSLVKEKGFTKESVREVASDYRSHVERVKEYIRAGDIFQANIARFWRMSMSSDALVSLYARLRSRNPAPFSAFFRAAEFTILSSSPERLFRMRDGWVDTRPIAGTRRRGDGVSDQRMREELLLSEKERAEHIMLVDLERNDLGRVCTPGSIEVDERMVIERYATVQHIVSNVRGRLQAGRDLIDVFRALFPGGTITGCPKVRCMQIIHEMEPCPREAYTGTLGYRTVDGQVDCNILIRSFWHHGEVLHWAAGAGIVADSDPVREWEETEHKAAGLLRALR